MATTDPHAEIAERFARDTAQHQMTVKHEDGLYRHLRFAHVDPKQAWSYWFDLVTWPGCLTIRGDIGTAYTFSRLPDMFEFFRGKQINPDYWSEKLDSGRSSVQVYSEELFRQSVVEHFVDAVRFGDAPRGLGKALRVEILDQDLAEEREARELLEDFEFKGFEFHDVWEWSFSDYDWSFLWACHAIVWGIGQYDQARKLAAAAVPVQGRDMAQDFALTVQIDGKPVPLDRCGWLHREACGCIVSAVIAVVTGQGGWTIATPEQAHQHFTKRKDVRAREIARGMTIELITMDHYREHIGAKWECDAHPRPTVAQGA